MRGTLCSNHRFCFSSPHTMARWPPSPFFPLSLLLNQTPNSCGLELTLHSVKYETHTLIRHWLQSCMGAHSGEKHVLLWLHTLLQEVCTVCELWRALIFPCMALCSKTVYVLYSSISCFVVLPESWLIQS